jgi:hypothetical protein
MIYGSYIDEWNTAMEVYKVCQPCRTYDLSASFTNYDDYYGGDDDGDGSYWGNPDDDGYSDPNEGYFWCADDADYTNVNQCMKFRTHADLEVATWEDLVTATNQGGILQVKVGDTVFGSESMSYQQVINYHYMLDAQDSEYKADVKAAKNLEQEAAPWVTRGHRMMFFGTAALVGSFAFVVFQRFQAQWTGGLSEPLVEQNPDSTFA